MLALTLITFISFVDDIRSTSQGLRLVFHFTAMALMFYQWGLFSLALVDVACGFDRLYGDYQCL